MSASVRYRLPSHLSSFWLVTVGAVVAVVAGVGARVLDWRLAVVVAIAGGTVVLAQRLEVTYVHGLVRAPDWVVRAAGPVWVATTLLPELRLLGGASRGVQAAARGEASADVMLQLLAAGLVIAAVVLVVTIPSDIRMTPTLGLFASFATFVALSTTWSRLPLFTLGRAIEFVAAAGMATLLAWAARARAAEGRQLGWVCARSYLLAVAPLVLWMYATPSHVDGRPTWPGAHPNAAGAVVGLAVVLLAAYPRRRILRVMPAWVAVALLLVVQIDIGSRGSSLATGAGVVAMLAVRGARDSRTGAVWLGFGAVIGAATAWTAWDNVLGFVLRDQSTERVFGLNGRRELWNGLLRDPVGNEVWGLGMGAARDQIPAAWAGNAHNAWVDLLLSVGVVGLALMAAVVVATTVGAIRWGRADALALVVFAVGLGLTETGFHDPGPALGALVLAVALVHDRPAGLGSSGR